MEDVDSVSPASPELKPDRQDNDRSKNRLQNDPLHFARFASGRELGRFPESA